MNLKKKNIKYTNFNKEISKVPGPSPWYLLSAKPKLSSKYGTLSWQEAGKKERMIGKVVLKTQRHEPLAIFDFYCYVLNLSRNHFLVWYWNEDQLMKIKIPSVEIMIINTDKLKKLNDVQKACDEMKKNNKKIHFSPEAIKRSISIPGNLKFGVNKITIPDEFKEINELLILGESTLIKRKPFHDYNNIAIYALRPKMNNVEIIPQDWFNYGNYDFGYQWITRVARDPLTHTIFGEGIRLGQFVLDSTGRKLRLWITKNPFYGPDY